MTGTKRMTFNRWLAGEGTSDQRQRFAQWRVKSLVFELGHASAKERQLFEPLIEKIALRLRETHPDLADDLLSGQPLKTAEWRRKFFVKYFARPLTGAKAKADRATAIIAPVAAKVPAGRGRITRIQRELQLLGYSKIDRSTIKARLPKIES